MSPSLGTVLTLRACEKLETRVYQWEFQNHREPWWAASVSTGSGLSIVLSLISWRKWCDDPSQTIFINLWDLTLVLTFQPPTVKGPKAWYSRTSSLVPYWHIWRKKVMASPAPPICNAFFWFNIVLKMHLVQSVVPALPAGCFPYFSSETKWDAGRTQGQFCHLHKMT